MNITRNNYEEFFMLYADNELAAAERAAVEVFIAANPDLQPELVLFQQFKATPDGTVVFNGKQGLLKHATTGTALSLENYASFLVLYADDELTNKEKAAIEDFVYHHPQLQAEFELLQQVRMAPDNSIVFKNKEILYRKEDDDKVIPFPWWRMAAAALVVLMLGAFWLYRSNNSRQTDLAQGIQPAKNNAPAPVKKTDTVTANVPVNSNAEPVKEQLALTGSTNGGRNTSSQTGNHTVPVPGNKAGNKDNEKVQPAKGSVVEEAVVVNTDTEKKLTGVALSSIGSTSKKVEVDKDIAAAKSIPDQQLIITASDENNSPKAEWASSNSDDKLEVLNTSVNTKNSMRGFLRKASRLIGKKTSLGEGDSNHKGILIGGFEIAVR